MSVIPQQYRCDAEGCNNVRGESNHWWMLMLDTDDFSVQPFVEGVGGIDGYRHACGSECVHKLLSQWMDSRREG